MTIHRQEGKAGGWGEGRDDSSPSRSGIIIIHSFIKYLWSPYSSPRTCPRCQAAAKEVAKTVGSLYTQGTCTLYISRYIKKYKISRGKEKIGVRE